MASTTQANFANSVDPDEMAYSELSHLVLQLPSSLQILYINQFKMCFLKFHRHNFVFCFLGTLRFRSEIVCLFDLLLNIHGKQLRLCWDGQLLNHSVSGQAFQRQFTSIKCPFFHQKLTTCSSKISKRDLFTHECAGREGRSRVRLHTKRTCY